MANDINRGMDVVSRPDLPSLGDTYRVNPPTRDSDRRPDDRFEQQLKKKKKKPGDKDSPENGGAGAGLEDLDRDNTPIHDGLTLSDSARKGLEKDGGSAPSEPARQEPDVHREDKDPENNGGGHIDLIA